MKDGKERYRSEGGRFLPHREERSAGNHKLRRWMTVTVLLAWDGILLYMIVRCLIEPVYGAAFVAVVSIYLGYQL